MLGPTWGGHGLRLRPPAEDDLPVLRHWYADPEITRFMFLDERCNRTSALWAEWLETVAGSSSCVFWSVEAGDRLVGLTALDPYDRGHRRATLTFVVARDCWGKGYASEQARLALGYGFGPLGLSSVDTMVLPANVRASKVVERLGFKLVGTKRRWWYRGGVWHDVLLWDLLPDEFAPLPRPDGV